MHMRTLKRAIYLEGFLKRANIEMPFSQQHYAHVHSHGWHHNPMRASGDRYGRTAMDYFDPVNSAKWAEVAVVDTAAFPVRSVLSDKMGNGTGLEDILLSEVSVCECVCVWWW
jgi:hypothetical protein